MNNSPTKLSNGAPELPPCCGSGCAVCVLDLVADHFPAPAAQPASATAATALPTEAITQRATASVAIELAANEAPVCCNTGCLVCVKDYPELFCADGEADAKLNTLLAAVESAQAALTSKPRAH